MVEGDGWLDEALELAGDVAERPPIAARLAKQAVLAADETTLGAGLEHERRLYELAMATEDRVEGMKAFLEKRKPEFHGNDVDGRPTVERIGVVGAGTMGPGSPSSPRSAATRLACTTPSRTRSTPGSSGCAARWRRAPRRGCGARRMPTRRAPASAPPPSLADLAGCDLVIEAAPEDLGLKRELFAALAEVCGPETILATNTSSLAGDRDRRRRCPHPSASSACTSSTRRR